MTSEECSEVPEQECKMVTDTECKTISEQMCKQVPEQICEDVTKTVCNTVADEQSTTFRMEKHEVLQSHRVIGLLNRALLFPAKACQKMPRFQLQPL